MLEHADQVALSLYDAATRKLLIACARSVDLFHAVQGVARGHVANKPWEELWHESPAQAGSIFHEVVKSRKARRLPPFHSHFGSERRVWNCRLIPIPAESSDGIQYVMMSAVEITEEARAREELEQLDHLKDDFLSLASHELRTPLMPLRTYSEVLTKLVEQPDRGKEWVNQVREVVGKFQRQIDHMARLADDLLDVARVESGRLSMRKTPLDLKALLATAVEHAGSRSPKPPPIRFSAPDLPPRVMVLGDEERLVQTVANLLVNAGHHASQSPHVDLRLELVERNGDRHARVSVRDYGPGIPPETLNTLFTRFTKGRDQRSSRSGLGLGLFIAHGIVQQHGGELRAESVPGDGATFVMELPLAEKLAAR